MPAPVLISPIPAEKPPLNQSAQASARAKQMAKAEETVSIELWLRSSERFTYLSRRRTPMTPERKSTSGFSRLFGSQSV